MAEQIKPERLESWKTIAEYLGRDVTTIIRWEREKGLPVRRQAEGKRSTVFAYTGEIDDWLKHGGSGGQLPGTARTSAEDGGSLQVLIEEEAPFDAPSSPGHEPEGSRGARRKPVAMIGAASAILLVAIATLFQTFRLRPVPNPPTANEVMTFNFPHSALRFQPTVIPVRGRGDLRAADLNNDGVIDLVVGGYPSDELEVLLGKGNGTFAPAQIYQNCPASNGPDVADLDKDGSPDIVAACYDAESIAIWWGKGSGTFESTPSRISVGRKPMNVRVADLNHDGLPDIVVDATGGTAITVLMNQGSRRFARRDYEMGFMPRRIAIADLDGDGNVDILAACMGEACQVRRVLKGNGDGSFRAVPFPSFGDGLFDMSVLDHKDGTPAELTLSVRDWKLLLVANPLLVSSATLVTLKHAAGPIQAAAADFDGDGSDEFAVLSFWTSRLSFLKRIKSGGYAESNEYKVGTTPLYMIAADLNGDHRLDLAFTAWDTEGGATLWVLLQVDDPTTAH